MTDALIVFCTCENEQQARRLATDLVERRLAACVNILPGVHSIYRWQGRVENAEEVLLLIKTTESTFAALAHQIHELHSYETPEIVGIAISNADGNYLDWLRQQVQPGSAS